MNNVLTRRDDRIGRAMGSVLFIALAALLVSCGGGGGGGTVIGGGGIGGTGISQGTVTGVGSIDLNGSVFTTTDDTPVTIDDRTGTFASLKAELEHRIGAVATVRATFTSPTTGTTSAITLRDNLEGKIENVDCATGTIIAMGKIVIVDASTKFQPAGVTCASLSPNDVIEVSGAQNNDRILASFIERKGTFQPGREVEVKGFISNLAGNSFNIGTLVVNVLDGTTQIDNSLRPLANGKSVEVKGTSYDNAGALNASKIEAFAMGISAGENERVELEGLVSECTATPCTAFAIGVDARPVSVTAATKFSNSLASDLVNGRKVEAEGVIQGGTLVAEKIEFKNAGSSGGGGSGGSSSGNVRIEAAQADSAGSGSTNSFQVLGITVKANALTKFKDGVSDAGGISAGDVVNVRGYANGASEVIASEIEKAGGGNQRVTLRGPIASPDASAKTFRILGVLVTTDSATKFAGGNVFAAPAGTLVQAKGRENPANQIDATGSDGEVELQN
jgi:hypothetical protein